VLLDENEAVGGERGGLS